MEILNKITGKTDLVSQKLPLPGPIKEKHGRKIGLLVGVVVAALVIGGLLWLGASVIKKDSLEDTQKSITQVITEGGDKDAVIRKLLSVQRQAGTKEGKHQASYILASRYAEADKHELALKYYEEAIKNAKETDINSLLGAAESAAELNNKDLAKKYYQQALDYYEPLSKIDSSILPVVDSLKKLVK